MLLSKIKEAIICFKARIVTFCYPLCAADREPYKPPKGFRGKLSLDVDKCTGCGACMNVCPARLITIFDEEEKRLIQYEWSRCTYCGRCQDECPEGAIVMTETFETAVNKREDMLIRGELPLASCENCQKKFATSKQLRKLIEEVPQKVGLDKETMSWLSTCPDCRRLTESQKMIQGGEVLGG